MEQFRELVDLPDLDLDEVFVEYGREDNEDAIARIPKRCIRDGLNPFELYENSEFKRRYRFSKESIIHGILPRIVNGLSKVSKRGLPIAPVFQLLLCLRFYATANFQHVSGDLFHISQPTVSRIIYRVSVMLAALMHECIKIPVNDEGLIENRRLFKEIGGGENGIGFPGIDGAIDCTHIRICHTNFGQLQEIYRNRKGYFSLNVQAVVGPRMEFLDVVPEWSGSQHDSRIFQNSRIYVRYLEGQLTGALVGDSGYPSLPFLFTPVANPVTDAQQR